MTCAARRASSAAISPSSAAMRRASSCEREREYFIDNLLVRVHFIIETIRWTGVALGEFEFSV